MTLSLKFYPTIFIWCKTIYDNRDTILISPEFMLFIYTTMLSQIHLSFAKTNHLNSDASVKIFLWEDYGSFGKVVSTGDAQPADDACVVNTDRTAPDCSATAVNRE
jgi:hypothetical protein